jgi:hypothetical protein
MGTVQEAHAGRESAELWTEFREGMRRRGLAERPQDCFDRDHAALALVVRPAFGSGLCMRRISAWSSALIVSIV